MESQPSNKPLSQDDLELERSLYEGEGSESIVRLTDFIEARDGLHRTLGEAIRGEGESYDEVNGHIELFVAEVAARFASEASHYFEDHDFDTACSKSGKLLDASLYGPDSTVEPPLLEDGTTITPQDLADLIRGEIENDQKDGPDPELILRSLCEDLHRAIVESILDTAPENENDLKQERRNAIKEYVISIARDIGVTAVGTLISSALMHHLKKR